MLARVAESLYWAARNLERCETLSRLLEVSHSLALERGSVNGAARAVWEPVVEITGDLDRFLESHRRADERSVSWFLTLSPVNPNSIIACVTRARLNARNVRDLLPTEVWEAVNGAYLEVLSWTPERLARQGVYPFCQAVRRSSHLIQGLVDQEMRHDEAWRFLRLGRYLERAEKTARLLEVKFHVLPADEPEVEAPMDLHQWRALLSAAAAREAYVQTDAAGLSPTAVARFLVLDELFPRAVNHCLIQVEESIAWLAAAGAMAPDPPPLALTRVARAGLEAARRPDVRGLAALCDRIQARCNEIGEAIAESSFAYPHDDPSMHERRPQAARQAQN
jgi:uncharacterized alpha-E superfamily protein